MTFASTKRLGGLALAATLFVAACGSGAASSPGGGVVGGVTASPVTSGQPAAGTIQIIGAGATFPFPLYSRWFYEYAFMDTSVKFNYQSIGSGGGIKQITARTVDFGASDAILNADQLAAAPGIQMFPAVAGADVAAYNVSELKDQKLVLNGPTLADIFLGKVTRWNDPAIAQLNPGLALPDKPIIVVHRSDGSGTTYIFTDFLSKVSDEWKTKVGNAASVEWPVGLGGKGNEGVAGTLAQNDGAIGYVELAYAEQNKLAIASMLNQAGATVEPSIETTQSAMSDFGSDLPETLAISIVNAPGAGSWPIAGYTYLLLYMDQADCTKAGKLIEFMKWAYDSDGSDLARELEYVPLPDAVREKVLARLAQVTCNGSPLGS